MSCISQEMWWTDLEIDLWVAGYCESDLKAVLQIEPGDRLVYYVKGLKGFTAICVARSRCFIDWKQIWPGDTYPCRFERRCEVLLPPGKVLPAKDLVPRLSFISPKLRNSRFWGLAFRRNLFQIPEEDFRLIEIEMKRLAYGEA